MLEDKYKTGIQLCKEHATINKRTYEQNKGIVRLVCKKKKNEYWEIKL